MQEFNLWPQIFQSLNKKMARGRNGGLVVNGRIHHVLLSVTKLQCNSQQISLVSAES